MASPPSSHVADDVALHCGGLASVVVVVILSLATAHNDHRHGNEVVYHGGSDVHIEQNAFLRLQVDVSRVPDFYAVWRGRSRSRVNLWSSELVGLLMYHAYF